MRAMTATAMIRTEGLGRRFDELVAVDALDLEVRSGEVFGFLGPNGAGKTTTLRLLCALLAPSTGRAWVAGAEVGRDDATIRAKVGILTETPGLYDKLTALENLELYGRLHRVPKLAQQIERYLRLLGLWPRRGDLSATFSKGMRQKLAIARALLHEPPVLFFDEPTSALDPASAKIVRDAIGELKREGRTIFLCTHNLAEAEALCDRLAFFKQRLLRLDTLANLRRERYGRVAVVRLADQADAKSAEELAPALRELSFVERVEVAPHTLRVALAEPERDNPELLRALVSQGGAVCWVEEERQTLERLYFDRIGGEGGEVGDGA